MPEGESSHPEAGCTGDHGKEGLVVHGLFEVETENHHTDVFCRSKRSLVNNPAKKGSQL